MRTGPGQPATRGRSPSTPDSPSDREALALPAVADALTTDQHHPGHIVAIAHLTDCHPDDGPCTPWAQPDRHHLVLTDIHPLPKPIAHRGALGLWNPPDDLLQQLADVLAT